MNEKQLIESCMAGDRKAQKALYDKYSRRMMGVCLRYAGEIETARDLLQDGFLSLFSSLPSYSGVGSFDGWVRRIFVNCALAHFRKKDVLDEAESLDIEVHEEIEDVVEVERLTVEEILAYVQRLPDRYRAVFNMFAIEGLSHKEIGEMLNIKEATSRSQYQRARMLLQKMILKH